MLKWESETGANGTCYWFNLPNDIEVSLFRGNGKNSPYLYSFKSGTDSGMLCHWTEHMTAKNWEKAKEKTIKKTIKIITNYLTDLAYALEVLNGEDCALG